MRALAFTVNFMVSVVASFVALLIVTIDFWASDDTTASSICFARRLSHGHSELFDPAVRTSLRKKKITKQTQDCTNSAFVYSTEKRRFKSVNTSDSQTTVVIYSNKHFDSSSFVFISNTKERYIDA